MASTSNAAPSPAAPVVNFVDTHHDTYPYIALAKTSLAGKSALITGASKGIGMATAIAFASAGCSKIAIAARSSLSEVETAMKEAAANAGYAAPPQVVCLNVDITSEESVKAAAETVSEAFGGSLDILIANAGYLETWLPVAESDPTDWWRSWEVNIRGTYLCARFFMPLLLKSESQTGPCLVAVTSMGAQMTTHGASAYQTTKFATCRLVQFLDAEYGGDKGNLVTMAFHPGGVKTELALNMPEFMHGLLMDTPELAAHSLVWLAGGQRKQWLAGRFINCQWDMEKLEMRKTEIVEKDLLKFRMAV
jgi:NAD(P)-dependent dehydrogenase (short-subunit alcohol dehydrogenase family)